MDFSFYLRLLRRWFWLIALTAFVGGSASYISRSGQPRVYQAETTLFIGGFIEDPNPGSDQIYTGFQLTETYAALVKTQSIAEATVEEGSFPVSPAQVRGMVSTEIVSNTTLLIIRVAYTDPVLTADIANEVANQLVLNSPTNLSPSQQSQLNLLEEQVEGVNQQISDAQEEMTLIDSQLNTLDLDDDQISRLQDRRVVLTDQVTTSYSTLAQLNLTLQGLQQQSNQLEIVETARIPTNPQSLNLTRSTAVGVIAGALLALGAVLAIEYLNDTVRTVEEVTAHFNLPVLGTVFRFGKRGDPYPARLVTHLYPSAPVSEAYRALRTNVLFTAQPTGTGNKRPILVTSSGPEEGKSVTAANLAVTMANAGMQVLLVDADLRRPKQHLLFDLENDVGLTTLLFSDPVSNEDPDKLALTIIENLKTCVQETTIPRLRVLSSGFIPANPAEILGSVLMKRWHEILIRQANVDVIIYDTPPTLVVSDSLVLAKTLQVPLLVVLRSGRTRRAAVARTKQQIENLGVNLLGIVLNYVDAADQSGGYYYYYSDSQRDGILKRVTSIFRR